MAWPAESGSIASGVNAPGAVPIATGIAVVNPVLYRVPFVKLLYSLIPGDFILDIGNTEIKNNTGRGKYYHTARSGFRVFNSAEYRFYWSTDGPPEEGAVPNATNATLAYETTDTFDDGTYYISVSYFNGVIDSGFLPLGAQQQKYLRLDLTSGTELENPPSKPTDVRLEQRANGVIRIYAYYIQLGSLRADTWCVYYTFNGSDPGSGATPDYTVAVQDSGMAILQYDLAAQAHGTTVNVRVQTRRTDDGTARYSDTDDDDIFTITADATGPDALPSADTWPGYMPEDI